MRLQQMSQALIDGNLPDRAVVVTFDDGYADNLYNAKPALERYNVPATFFLTTGYIGHKREFWWDELDRLLLQPAKLPNTLRLSVNGSTYQWKLGRAANYSKITSWRARYWRARNGIPASRHRLWRSLSELLHALAEGERRQVLDTLLMWADAEPMVRPSHRPLSLKEVDILAKGELVEVGAHTITHPALSTLPVASQRDEILGSKARLEEVLNHPVTSFAYPYGTRSDYTAETVAIVREAGFACACSNFADIVERSTDRFQLPRIPVFNWDGKAFAKRLSGWINA